MKNMKKLVALFAATVMTMSLSLSAFAATVDTTVGGEGDKTSEFRLVFDVPENATDEDIDQMTMIAYLVDAKTDPENIPDYSSQTIVAMDQVDGEAGFTSVPVDVEKLEEGYAIAVAIGGTDVAAANVYKALVTYDAETETITVVCGDVNDDGVADLQDATYILGSIGRNDKYGEYAIGTTITTIGELNIVSGDVNDDGVADLQDATYILGSIGRNDKYGSYAIGTPITFEVPATNN